MQQTRFMCVTHHDDPLYLLLEIYRIVSNKALESSGEQIKPTAGETISVSQQQNEQKQGGCC